MTNKPYITKHPGLESGRPFWQLNYPDYKERGYKADIFQSEKEATEALKNANKA